MPQMPQMMPPMPQMPQMGGSLNKKKFKFASDKSISGKTDDFFFR